MRKLIFAAIIIAIFIAAGCILYWQYTKTPKYSLLQAKKAFEQHDLASFEKYIDIEGISCSLIEQALETADKQEKPKDNLERFGELIGKGLLTLLKPRLSKLVKEQVTELVETGKFEVKKENKVTEEPEFLLSNIWSKVGGENVKLQGIEYVKEEGKIAYVGLKLYQEKYNAWLVLDVKMRDLRGYWQVVKLSNFGEYMEKIDELETKRINEINSPIIESIKKTLVVKEIQKRNDWGKDGMGKIDSKVNLYLQLENIGQKEIDEYKILLICKTLEGKELKSLSLTDSSNILPGKTGGGIWSTEVNMFIISDKLLFDTLQPDLDLKANVQYIKFTDGTELKLFEKGR